MSDTSAYYGDYGLAEASAIRRRKRASIANQQAAAMGQRRGNRNIADLQRQYQEGFTPMVSGYNRRGLGGANVRSGVRTAGLERYAQNLQRELGRESEDLQDQLTNIAFKETSEQEDLADYLAELRLAKQKEILGSAVDIRQMASY